ncbi:MAG TPA: sialidase family protein [Cyclobacteriaceae bacterium]|nr:sialidase family protein [Cyclobacteriaceae bacterium]
MRGITLLLIFVSSIALAQTTNNKLGELDATSTAGAAVAVSPRNNKNIVAWAAGKLVYSNDAGVTWKDSQPTISDVGKGTPSVAVDSKGNFFVAYSNPSLTQVFCSSSSDDGKAWSVPVVISGLPGKEKYNVHIAAQPRKEGLIVTWTESDKYGAEGDDCKSNIMMSASGSGKKWSAPLQVNQDSGNCLDGDFTSRGSAACIAHDGKIFILWARQGFMYYDRSYDGNMWISSDLAIIAQPGGWNINVPGFGDIANTPVFAIDTSPSRIQGTLFMVYSDTKSGEEDADIWLTRSVSRGDNWTVPARINQDEPGREQFLPQVSIDPANGHVYILYYDRRNYTDNQTDVYLSWSVDGGNQFKEKKINDQPFTPALTNTGLMTGYLSISAQKGLVIPVWSAINNGKQEVWTAVLKEAELNKPEPTKPETTKP